MTVALSPEIYAKVLKEAYKQTRKIKKRVSMHDVLIQAISKGLENL